MGKIKDHVMAGMAVVTALDAINMGQVKQEGSMEIEILGERFLVPQDITEEEVREMANEKIRKDVEKVVSLWQHLGFRPFMFDGYQFWASNKKAAEKKYIRWKETQTK